MVKSTTMGDREERVTVHITRGVCKQCERVEWSAVEEMDARNRSIVDVVGSVAGVPSRTNSVKCMEENLFDACATCAA